MYLKKIAAALLTVLAFQYTVVAQQVPQAVNYQALMRNSSGSPLTNAPVSVRFTVRKDNVSGSIAYQEVHNTATNTLGLVNLVIGFGTPVSGTMNSIDWASAPHFLQVESDPGSGWVNLGTTQFMSVPFALVAGKVLGGGGSGTGTSAKIQDADQNTNINTELYPNENLIRVTVDGLERWQFEGSRLVSVNNANSIYIGAETGKSTQPFGDKHNTFIGHSAGRDNQSGYGNTFLGAYSGQQTTTEDNTYIGANAGRVNQTGYVNTFVGEAAGFSNKTGAANTFIGQVAGFMTDNGAYNTFIGRGAGHENISGHHNVYLGRSAAFRNIPGHHNIYIGNLAGMRNTEGDNELYIDTDTMFAAPLIYGHFESRRVGINRKALTNALEVQGTASKAAPGEWLGNSDERLKKNIVALEPNTALDQLLQLKGVTYEWNDHNTDNERPTGKQFGFVAQNVEKVFPELVKKDAQGYLQTAYGTYDPLTVEAIRALDSRVKALETENKLLREKLDAVDALKAEIEKLKQKQ